MFCLDRGYMDNIGKAVTQELTVLMPAFNSGRYIAQAICSILSQTYTNYKFIILDDGSDDDTGRIIAEFARIDSRIIFIKNDENRGVSYSWQILSDKVQSFSLGWTLMILPLLNEYNYR